MWIASAIHAPSVWVAEAGVAIVGVLRGGRVDELGRTVLQSLFVSGNHQRQGIGQRPVERFDKEYILRGVTVFKLPAAIHAVPFHPAMGYRKSTGGRYIHSFEGHGFAIPADEEGCKRRLKHILQTVTIKWSYIFTQGETYERPPDRSLEGPRRGLRGHPHRGQDRIAGAVPRTRPGQHRFIADRGRDRPRPVQGRLGIRPVQRPDRS